MDIRLSQLDPRDTVRLFLGDALVAEIAVGEATLAPVLLEQVVAARALRRLAWCVRHWQTALQAASATFDHAEPTPAARTAAFCRGLEAGLTGETTPHPPGAFPHAERLPPLLPEASVTYERGYEHGETMRVSLAILTEHGGA